MVSQAFRWGATIIEMLIVIAIIAILISVLLPAVQSSREAARRISCGNNLRQLCVALRNYEAANLSFPAGSITDFDQQSSDILGTDGVFANGFTMLLPFLEEQTLADQYDSNKTWYLQDSRVAATVLGVLTCPSNGSKPNPHTDYFVGYAANSVGSPLGNTLGLTDQPFPHACVTCVGSIL